MIYTTHGLMTAADLEEHRQDTDWYEQRDDSGEYPAIDGDDVRDQDED